MSDLKDVSEDNLYVTKIETILILGIFGCLFFGAWELSHMMVDNWFASWVMKNEFVNKRLIYYGLASLFSIGSIILTLTVGIGEKRFGRIVSRAFLWFGVITLLVTISIFVFDCLPEICAGFLGAGLFIAALYLLQKRLFTPAIVQKSRVEKGKCFSCGSKLKDNAIFCHDCGEEVMKKCSSCTMYNGKLNVYCQSCGTKF